MLNVINTILFSGNGGSPRISGSVNDPHSTGSPDTGTNIILPNNIKDGSYGILVVMGRRNAHTNSPTIDIGNISDTTGKTWTLFVKNESVNGGTGRGASTAIFGRYMSSSDSSATLSNLYANGAGDYGYINFIEIQNFGGNALRTITHAGSSDGASGTISIGLNPSESLIPHKNFLIIETICGSGTILNHNIDSGSLFFNSSVYSLYADYAQDDRTIINVYSYNKNIKTIGNGSESFSISADADGWTSGSVAVVGLN